MEEEMNIVQDDGLGDVEDIDESQKDNPIQDGEDVIREKVSLSNERKLAAIVFYYKILVKHMEMEIKDTDFVMEASGEFMEAVKSEQRTLERKLRIFRFIDSTKYKTPESVLKLYIIKLLELLRYRPRKNIRLLRDTDMKTKMIGGISDESYPWRRGRPRKRGIDGRRGLWGGDGPGGGGGGGGGRGPRDDVGPDGGRTFLAPPPPPRPRQDFPGGGRRLGGPRGNIAGFPIRDDSPDQTPPPSPQTTSVFRRRPLPQSASISDRPPRPGGSGAERINIRSSIPSAHGGAFKRAQPPPPPQSPFVPISAPPTPPIALPESRDTTPILRSIRSIYEPFPLQKPSPRPSQPPPPPPPPTSGAEAIAQRQFLSEISNLTRSFQSVAEQMVSRMTSVIGEIKMPQNVFAERRPRTPYVPQNTPAINVNIAPPHISVAPAPITIAPPNVSVNIPQSISAPAPARAVTPSRRTATPVPPRTVTPARVTPQRLITTRTKATSPLKVVSPMKQQSTERGMTTSPQIQRTVGTDPELIPRKEMGVMTSPIREQVSPEGEEPVDMEVASILRPERYEIQQPPREMLMGAPHRILQYMSPLVVEMETIHDVPLVATVISPAKLAIESRPIVELPPSPEVIPPSISEPVVPRAIAPQLTAPSKAPTPELVTSTPPSKTLMQGARPKEKIAIRSPVQTRSRTAVQPPSRVKTRLQSGIILSPPERLEVTFPRRPIVRKSKKKVKITSDIATPDMLDPSTASEDVTAIHSATALVDSTRVATGGSKASESINISAATKSQEALKKKKLLYQKARALRKQNQKLQIANRRRSERIKAREEELDILNLGENPNAVIPLATIRREDMANDSTYDATVPVQPLIAPVQDNSTHETISGGNERLSATLSQINRGLQVVAENSSRAARSLRENSMVPSDRLVSSRTELSECVDTVIARREAINNGVIHEKFPEEAGEEISAPDAFTPTELSQVHILPPLVLDAAVNKYIGLSSSDITPPTEFNTHRQPSIMDRQLASRLANMNYVDLDNTPANMQQHAQPVHVAAARSHASPHPPFVMADILLRLRSTINDMRLLASDQTVDLNYREEANAIIQQANEFLMVAQIGLTSGIKAGAIEAEEGEDINVASTREDYERRLYEISEEARGNRDGLIYALREAGVPNLNYIGEVTENDSDYMTDIRQAEEQFLQTRETPGETLAADKGFGSAEDGSYIYITHLARQLRRAAVLNAHDTDDIMDKYIKLSTGLSRSIMSITDLESDETTDLLEQYQNSGAEYLTASREFLITNNVLQLAFRNSQSLVDSLINLQRTHLNVRSQMLNLFNRTQVIFSNANNSAELARQNDLIESEEIPGLARNIIEASSGNLNAVISSPNSADVLSSLSDEITAAGVAGTDERGVVDSVVTCAELLHAESEIAEIEIEGVAVATGNTLINSEHTGEPLTAGAVSTAGDEELPQLREVLTTSDVPLLTGEPSSTEDIIALTANNPEAMMKSAYAAKKRPRLTTAEMPPESRKTRYVPKRAFTAQTMGSEQLPPAEVKQPAKIVKQQPMMMPPTISGHRVAVPNPDMESLENTPLMVIDNYCSTGARRSSRTRARTLRFINGRFAQLTRGAPSPPDLIAARNFIYAAYLQTGGRMNEYGGKFEMGSLLIDVNDLIYNNANTLQTNVFCKIILDEIKRNWANTEHLNEILPLIVGSEYLQNEMPTIVDQHVTEIPRSANIEDTHDQIESIDQLNPQERLSPEEMESLQPTDEIIDYETEQPPVEEEPDEFFDASEMEAPQIEPDEAMPLTEGRGYSRLRHHRHISKKSKGQMSRRYKAARARSRVNLLSRRPTASNFSHKLFMKYLGKYIHAGATTIHDEGKEITLPRVGHGLMHNRGRMLTPHHYTRTYCSLLGAL